MKNIRVVISFLRPALVLAMVLCVQALTPTWLTAQRRAELTSIPVRDIHFEALELGSLLRQFAREYKIVVGFETLSLAKAKTLHIDVQSGSVADVMDALVNTTPGYAWHLDSNGAIHVYSVGQRLTLVDIKLDQFVVNNQSRRDVWEAFDRAPEVKAWLTASECSRGELFQGHEWKQNSNKFSFNGSGETIEHILDKAAAASEVYFWQVEQYHLNGQCYVNIKLW
jgi:hypothetical protein